jgi:hypothetical protein
LTKLLQDDPRPGHPLEISPPPTGPDRRTRVPGTRRLGVAHHSLVQRGSSPPSRCGRHH